VQLRQPRIADVTTLHKSTPHKSTPHKSTPHKSTPHKATTHKATTHKVTPHKSTLHNTQDTTESDDNEEDTTESDDIEDNITDSDENDEQFFRRNCPGSKDLRMKRLLRIARNINNPKESNLVRSLASERSKDPITQATALYRTIENLSNRNYRLYFADALERCTAVSKAKGDMKKTIALNKISALLGVDRQKLVDMDQEGKTYLTCMEIGGAGSLNSINGAKTE
jgi:hypothetical protein